MSDRWIHQRASEHPIRRDAYLKVGGNRGMRDVVCLYSRKEEVRTAFVCDRVTKLPAAPTSRPRGAWRPRMPAARRPSKSPARAAKSPARASPRPRRVSTPADAGASSPPPSPHSPSPASPSRVPWEEKDAYSFETGERFRHPGLAKQDTLKLLCKVWQPGSFVSVFLLLSTIWLGLPSWIFQPLSWCPGFFNAELAARAQAHGAGMLTDNQVLLVSLGWRFSYNIVLGVILRAQSEAKVLTCFCERLAKLPQARR